MYRISPTQFHVPANLNRQKRYSSTTCANSKLLRIAKTTAEHMTWDNSDIKDKDELNLWLFLKNVAQHVQSKVIKVKLDSSSKHQAAEKEPPKLVLICDRRLKFSKKVVLNTVPLFDWCPIIHKMHCLNNRTFTSHTMQFRKNKWKVIVEKENYLKIFLILNSILLFT